MASACVHVMNLDKSVYDEHTESTLSHSNVSCGEYLTIRALADTIAEVVGYEGRIKYDATKPDRTICKLMNSSKLMSLGWQPTISLKHGSYLAEFLIEKGYQLHGIKRSASSFNTERIAHLYEAPHIERTNLVLHYGDLTDSSNLICLVSEIRPDKVYILVLCQKENDGNSSSRVSTCRDAAIHLQ